MSFWALNKKGCGSFLHLFSLENRHWHELEISSSSLQSLWLSRLTQQALFIQILTVQHTYVYFQFRLPLHKKNNCNKIRFYEIIKKKKWDCGLDLTGSLWCCIYNQLPSLQEVHSWLSTYQKCLTWPTVKIMRQTINYQSSLIEFSVEVCNK